MNWYNTFNAIEAGLWGVVAIVIPLRVTCVTWQERCGALLGSCAFVAFGITDILEIGKEGFIPLWLWGFKIACGCSILAARYTWLGWNKFRWRDRELLFGLFCLISVCVLITLQRYKESLITPATSARHSR
ncbi:MAG: hypothetical protein JWN70_2435 [Planctomycetaceae bacterium]|nr:hypothetical protein [Planctomycetaceae bacterium]